MKITVENLFLNIKKEEILKGINLSLTQGKLIMLLGNNGAGKTQLIKTIMGFKKPTKGNIFYGTKNIESIKFKDRAKFVSYVPQTEEQDTHYTVEDFIAMGFMPELSFFSSPTPKMKEQVAKTMKQLEIAHLAGKYTNEISGGEFRLCYLARALVQGTPWMILDEPTSSLDFAKQHHFLKLIKQTAIKENTGTLMSIHNPSLACDYGDIIILMKNGKILDIIDMIENDAYSRLEKSLKVLYGDNLTFEDTTQGKTLVWRDIENGFH